MAAQEYYNTNGANGQQSRPGSGAAPPHGPLLSTPANPPYPLYDGPPPPYSPGEQRPHSQPPPQNRVNQIYSPEKVPQDPRAEQYQAPLGPPPQQRPQLSSHIDDRYRPHPDDDYEAQFRPPVRQQHSHSYANEHHDRPLKSAMKQNPHYSSAQPVQPPYSGYANGPSFMPARQRPRSRSRSRSSSHSRNGARRSQQPKKKSGNLNTFLGSAGGAMIGDAIFPGLGTIGGALLGGLGGHEYNKQRARSHETRHRDRRYSDEYDRPSRRY